MGRLDGKVAVITGTGGGQGRAAAQMFTREGASVVGCDVKIEGNQQTVELVRAAGGTFIGLAPLDVTVPEQARRVVETACDALGGIDIVYNNASAQRFSPFAEITPEDWRFTMTNDLDIVLPITQSAWPHMTARGGGSVIIVSSVAALRGTRAFPTLMHATAKAGLIGFGRALAAEGAKHQIRVNTICPGTIETPAVDLHVDDDYRAGVDARVPLGRIGRPDDVAAYALFLASDESSWITGTVLPVDGGTIGVR